MGTARQPRPDAEGFCAFVTARQAALLRSAWLVTGDENEAQDLLQEALTRVWVHWHRVSRDGNPEMYVRKVMVNAQISWWRQRRSAESTPVEAPNTASLFEAVEQRPRILQALRSLPPRQRAVVVLRYYDDLSEADTAAILDCSVGTVKSQCHKALSKLRQLYDTSQPMGSDPN